MTDQLFTDPVVEVVDYDLVDPCAVAFADVRPALRAKIKQAYRLPFGRHCDYLGCYARAEEYHHWAPKAIFKMLADRFDGASSWLCKEHHQLVTQMIDDYYRRRFG